MAMAVGVVQASNCSYDLTPSLGTSICYGCCHKMKRKNIMRERKKERERERERKEGRKEGRKEDQGNILLKMYRHFV